MPVSSSLKRNYSLPGAVSGDKRLLDIQAIKAALEAIDVDHQRHKLDLIVNFRM